MRFRRLTAAFCLIFWATASAPACADAPAAPAPSAAAAISPGEAQQAVDALQDPAKRAALIGTLQTIAKAQGAAPAPAKPASASPAKAAATPAIAGVGAKILLDVSRQTAEVSREFAVGAAAAAQLPLFWTWLTTTATDPAAQARLFEFLLRLAATLGGALVVEYLARLALRRPFAALERRAMRGWSARSEGPARPAGAARPRVRRFLKLRRVLGRIPFAFARLALELIPVALFAILANLLLATSLGADPGVRLSILVLVNAYVLCRAVMSAMRAIACQIAPATSLLILPDHAAAYLERWTRRIVGVVVWGLAFANVALALGLSAPAYDAFVKLTALLAHILLLIVTLQCRGVVARLIRAPSGRTDFVAILRNRLAAVWHYLAIFANLGLWTIWALRVQNGYVALARYALSALAIALFARAAFVAATGALERGLNVAPAGDPRLREFGTRAGRYYPALRGLLAAITAGAAAIVLLQVWGLDAFAWFAAGAIGGAFLSAAWTILIAITIALLIWESCDAAIERYLARLSREAQYTRAARLRTLLPTLRTALVLAILTVVGLTALSQIGVNVAPLLAGAGIVGIAVGFGSQKLVQDVITGLFLLLENAMQVGDWVTAAGLSGTVEYLSIRSLRLRAADGSVHVIPFSSVTTVTNSNRGIGNAEVKINLAFEEDVDRASRVLKEVAADMRADKTFGPMMRGDLDLWGVDRFDAATVTLVGQIQCTDSGRWPVQREFNRRMKSRFQQLGIEIAYPSETRIIAEELPVRRSRAPRSAAQ